MARPKKAEIPPEFKQYAPEQPFKFNGEDWVIVSVTEMGLLIKPKSKKVSIAKDAFVPFTSIKS